MRHHPCVNHIIGGQHNTDFLVDRHDERVVDFHQVGVAAWRVAFDLVAWCGEVGQKVHALSRAIDIFVTPFPLIPGDFDGQVGTGSVFHGHDGTRGGQRHGNDNDEGDDGPGDFHTDVFV